MTEPRTEAGRDVAAMSAMTRSETPLAPLVIVIEQQAREQALADVEAEVLAAVNRGYRLGLEAVEAAVSHDLAQRVMNAHRPTGNEPLVYEVGVGAGVADMRAAVLAAIEDIRKEANDGR